MRERASRSRERKNRLLTRAALFKRTHYLETGDSQTFQVLIAQLGATEILQFVLRVDGRLVGGRRQRFESGDWVNLVIAGEYVLGRTDGRAGRGG